VAFRFEAGRFEGSSGVEVAAEATIRVLLVDAAAAGVSRVSAGSVCDRKGAVSFSIETGSRVPRILQLQDSA
jgi:hypothetical protein